MSHRDPAVMASPALRTGRGMGQAVASTGDRAVLGSGVGSTPGKMLMAKELLPRTCGTSLAKEMGGMSTHLLRTMVPTHSWQALPSQEGTHLNRPGKSHSCSGARLHTSVWQRSYPTATLPM